MRKVKGTVKNHGQISKSGDFSRPEYSAKQVKKIQEAREARGGYGKVEHETRTAERRRREAASASLPYIHGLTAKLLRCPSMRCTNCVPTTADGLLLATGCTHHKISSTGYAELSVAELGKLNNPTDLLTGAESFLLRSTPSSRMRARTTRSRLFIYFCNFYSITERR